MHSVSVAPTPVGDGQRDSTHPEHSRRETVAPWEMHSVSVAPTPVEDGQRDSTHPEHSRRETVAPRGTQSTVATVARTRDTVRPEHTRLEAISAWETNSTGVATVPRAEDGDGERICQHKTVAPREVIESTSAALQHTISERTHQHTSSAMVVIPTRESVHAQQQQQQQRERQVERAKQGVPQSRLFRSIYATAAMKSTRAEAPHREHAGAGGTIGIAEVKEVGAALVNSKLKHGKDGNIAQNFSTAHGGSVGAGRDRVHHVGGNQSRVSTPQLQQQDVRAMGSLQGQTTVESRPGHVILLPSSGGGLVQTERTLQGAQDRAYERTELLDLRGAQGIQTERPLTEEEFLGPNRVHGCDPRAQDRTQRHAKLFTQI